MASGVIDLYCQDTNPGANSTFAPPWDWEGNEEAYILLMRYQYAKDLKTRQQIDVLVHRYYMARQLGQRLEVTFEGPFARPAETILNKLVEKDINAARVVEPKKAASKYK